MNDGIQLLKAKEAAKMLGLKLETFYRYVSFGRIDIHSRKGRSVYFHPEEIERYKNGIPKAKTKIVSHKNRVGNVAQNRQRIAEIERTAESAIFLNARNEPICTLKRGPRKNKPQQAAKR